MPLIFCLSQRNKEVDDIVIKVEKMNPYEEVGEIGVGARRDFGVVMLNNRIFVMGGRIGVEKSKSVSVNVPACDL